MFFFAMYDNTKQFFLFINNFNNRYCFLYTGFCIIFIDSDIHNLLSTRYSDYFIIIVITSRIIYQ